MCALKAWVDAAHGLTDGRPVNAHEIQPGSKDFERACAWAEAHFELALLYLADVSPPLAAHARFFSATRDARTCGVAVRFEAFETKTLACAAEDVEACAALIDAGRMSQCILIAHARQALPASLRALPAAMDVAHSCLYARGHAARCLQGVRC
jgi:hypothetical protein